MGMYTELNIGVEFKKDTPQDILNAVQYMIDNNYSQEFNKDHELFQTSRWDWMLRSGGSYYFDTKPSRSFLLDDVTETYFLSFVTNIKNYDNEWEKFLDYISPYVANQGYVGTYRYEEEEYPSLVIINNGKYSLAKAKPEYE